jgi:hypothetical protein
VRGRFPDRPHASACDNREGSVSLYKPRSNKPGLPLQLDRAQRILIEWDLGIQVAQALKGLL